MGKLSACLVLALAACGSSNSKKPPDAQIVVPDAPPDAKVFLDAAIDAPPVFNLACLGNTTYPTAAANITVSGTANEVTVSGAQPMFTPMSGATVDVCQGNCSGNGAGNANLKSTTTDSAGAFSDGPFPTGGTHIAVYLRLTAAPPNTNGDKVVLEYPGEDLTADFSGVPMFTLSTSALGLLQIGGCTQDPTKGLVAVAVTDCSNTPISDSANVVLSIKQGSTAVGDAPINIGQFVTQAKGTYLICNVPAGTTTVGATYKGMTFMAHDVNSVADEITATQVRPGV